MTDRKIFFTDLDGTLLNDKKEVSPGNREAIDKALAAGHKVVISTGRALPSALDQAKKVGLMKDGCFIISYNGAVIYDIGKEKVIHSSTVPVEYIRYLFDRGYEMDIHMQTYSPTHVVAERDREELHRYTGIQNLEYKVVERMEDEVPQGSPKALAVAYGNRELLQKYWDTIRTWAEGKVDIFFSSMDYLELVAPGVSKGNAVRLLCDYLEIPVENTVSAGDAENDIEMLRATQIGAVMVNAQPQMHQYGNYITEHDNNSDGVAEIINKFILQEGI
ncbi:MAG: Cof-type HAD-IIB family hydrolase [Muricoprocola sp.]